MPKPTDRRSWHETETLERHAAAQLRSEAKRKARNAPRRDDLNRAGYYILLLTILEAEAQGEIERAQRLRRRMRLVLEDAGFAADVSVAVTVRSAADARHVRDPTRHNRLASCDDVMASIASRHPVRTPNKKHPRSGCSQGVADLAASLIGLGMRRSAGRLLLSGGGR